MSADPTCTGYVVQCDFDHPENLTPGFHTGKTGLYIIWPNSLRLVDFDGAAFDRSQEITQGHIQGLFERISGRSDLKITKVHLATTFTDRCKQAANYRKGRILLAGDAAHIHSPLGAQGLNVGLGDAMNLGWKLASTIRGSSQDLTLLNTYETERHPVGAWALQWTHAQIATRQPTPYGAAMQSLVREFIDTLDGTNLFIDRFWGLSQRYYFDGVQHPLVGCSAPDFEMLDGERLGPRMDSGRGLLVDFGDEAVLKGLVVGTKYENRVEYLRTRAKDQRGIRALLVRPDGVVAWAVEDDDKLDVDTARDALERWFGC